MVLRDESQVPRCHAVTVGRCLAAPTTTCTTEPRSIAVPFEMIRAESDLAGFTGGAESVVVRMIHASGQIDLTEDTRISARAVDAARTALAAGAPILCDVMMVASGVTRSRLPADNDVLCLLGDRRTPDLATQLGPREPLPQCTCGDHCSPGSGGHRQRPHGTVRTAGADRRRRAPAGRHRRGTRRFHRRRGIVRSAARTERPRTRHRPGSTRRLGHHRGSGQRAGKHCRIGGDTTGRRT